MERETQGGKYRKLSLNHNPTTENKRMFVLTGFFFRENSLKVVSYVNITGEVKSSSVLISWIQLIFFLL